MSCFVTCHVSCSVVCRVSRSLCMFCRHVLLIVSCHVLLIVACLACVVSLASCHEQCLPCVVSHVSCLSCVMFFLGERRADLSAKKGYTRQHCCPDQTRFHAHYVGKVVFHGWLASFIPAFTASWFPVTSFGGYACTPRAEQSRAIPDRASCTHSFQYAPRLNAGLLLLLVV